MLNLTRRNVLLTAACAGAAFGLPKPVSFVEAVLAQKGPEVGQQQRLMLVDDDSRGGMKCLNVHDPEAKIGIGDKLFESIREIDELGRLCGRDLNRRRVAAGRHGCERVHR